MGDRQPESWIDNIGYSERYIPLPRAGRSVPMEGCEVVDTIVQGDALTVLKTFPDDFIDCCVTSPPYWGLRDYGVEGQQGSSRVPGKTNGPMKAVRFGGNKQCPDTRLQSGKEWNPKMAGGGTNISGHAGYFKADGTPFNGLMVNKKSVWTITTKPFKEAHFATFPEDLIRPMILAGCPEGGIVLDPFIGSGTVARVAVEHRRHYIGIDLNTQYVEMAEKRRQTTQRLFV